MHKKSQLNWCLRSWKDFVSSTFPTTLQSFELLDGVGLIFCKSFIRVNPRQVVVEALALQKNVFIKNLLICVGIEASHRKKKKLFTFDNPFIPLLPVGTRSIINFHVHYKLLFFHLFREEKLPFSAQFYCSKPFNKLFICLRRVSFWSFFFSSLQHRTEWNHLGFKYLPFWLWRNSCFSEIGYFGVSFMYTLMEGEKPPLSLQTAAEPKSRCQNNR